MKTDTSTIHARVHSHRTRKGLTYRQAAAESNVDKQNIMRVEHGLMPSLQTFGRLAIWCGMSADSIKKELARIAKG